VYGFKSTPLQFGSLTNPVKRMKIWAYPPPYQSGVGLSGTLSTPLSLRYVQTTPTIPYARDEQSRGRKTNNHGICQRTYNLKLSTLLSTQIRRNPVIHAPIIFIGAICVAIHIEIAYGIDAKIAIFNRP